MKISNRTFKTHFLRLLVHFRRFRRSFKVIKPEFSKLTPFEEKGIKLWKMCLKDDNCQMAYNSYGDRQIEKNTLFITLNPHVGTDAHTMTIMDITNERRCVYELHLDGKSAKDVCQFFDEEMDKRMKKKESIKRSLIETDIDKLIEEEQMSLSFKKNPNELGVL